MDERPAGPRRDPRTDPPTDPQWPQLLALSTHEFRSPLTAVAGYIRMLLQDRAGPLSDQQRQLLQEAEKSCGRLSYVLAEVSELSRLEAGTAPFNRGTVNLTSILAAVIDALPALTDRAVTVTLVTDGSSSVDGDPVRLQTAFSSILHALRRELVTSDELVVRVETRDDDGVPALCIAMGEPSRIARLLHAEPAALVVFDEWRGGNGLSLPNARRIIEAHGGHVRSVREAGQADDKACAIVVLPSAR